MKLQLCAASSTAVVVVAVAVTAVQSASVSQGGPV